MDKTIEKQLGKVIIHCVDCNKTMDSSQLGYHRTYDCKPLRKYKEK